jgi:serine protease Do
MKLKLTIAISFLAIQLFSQDIERLYSELNPSVVTILVKENKLVNAGPNDVRQVSAEGLGSGVYVSEEGYIITASHVVHNAESIMVLFPNGEKAPAKVKSSSEAADIAIIKTLYKPNNKIPVAKLGDSDLSKIGEKVMIIGAPYGLEHSLSVGYLSGRHSQKSLVSGTTKIEYLQTDAAINHGNSGGPMFNMNGEVIGIVSHILSESGGFEGLGFASSIDIAKDILENKSNRWFGIDAILLDKKIASSLNVPSGGGLLIQRVVRNSPGGQAGFKGGDLIANIDGREVILGGDIIIAINDMTINSDASLEKVGLSLNNTENGGSVTVTLLRAGKEVKIELLKP